MISCYVFVLIALCFNCPVQTYVSENKTKFQKCRDKARYLVRDCNVLLIVFDSQKDGGKASDIHCPRNHNKVLHYYSKLSATPVRMTTTRKKGGDS